MLTSTRSKHLSFATKSTVLKRVIDINRFAMLAITVNAARRDELRRRRLTAHQRR